MSTPAETTQDALRTTLLVSGDDGYAPFERSVTECSCIGRDEECEIRLDSPLVSRRHAELRFEDDGWLLVDLGSTNGTFVNGERVERVDLRGSVDVQFGNGGPMLHFAAARPADAPIPDEGKALPFAPRTSDSAPDPVEPPPAPTPAHPPLRLSGEEGNAPAESQAEPDIPFDDDNFPFAIPAPISWARRSEEEITGRPASPAAPARREKPKPAAAPEPQPEQDAALPGGQPGNTPGSLDEYVQHYFGQREGPVGEHTMFIRQAYAVVQRKQQRTYVGLIAAVAVICLGALGYAAYQQYVIEKLEKRAESIAVQMRRNDVENAKLVSALVVQGGEGLDELLGRIEEQRQEQNREYDAYIEELGIRRSLSAEDRAIYRVARVFNESELSMPAGFVRAVKEKMYNYWLTPGGRRTFEMTIRQAEEKGYTPIIARSFQRYGLPPQFFFLAMQESAFRYEAIGPATRWGIAKGMWQFIPSTGQAYGLSIGPLADQRIVDPLDERHNVALATDAAARYLLDIYGQLAQASGLLAMASYNWGERRVISKLNERLRFVKNTPEERTYWRFYTNFSHRMPEETKDYVLKIAAAAAIGENPRLFGFDFDPPLARYTDPAPGLSTAE